jgi:hypothetical protein
MTGLFASSRRTVVLREEGISQAGSKYNERLGSNEKQLKSGTVPQGSNQPVSFDLCSVAKRAIESLCG